MLAQGLSLPGLARALSEDIWPLLAQQQTPAPDADIAVGLLPTLDPQPVIVGHIESSTFAIGLPAGPLGLLCLANTCRYAPEAFRTGEDSSAWHDTLAGVLHCYARGDERWLLGYLLDDRWLARIPDGETALRAWTAFAIQLQFIIGHELAPMALGHLNGRTHRLVTWTRAGNVPVEALRAGDRGQQARADAAVLDCMLSAWVSCPESVPEHAAFALALMDTIARTRRRGLGALGPTELQRRLSALVRLAQRRAPSARDGVLGWQAWARGFAPRISAALVPQAKRALLGAEIPDGALELEFARAAALSDEAKACAGEGDLRRAADLHTQAAVAHVRCGLPQTAMAQAIARVRRRAAELLWKLGRHQQASVAYLEAVDYLRCSAGDSPGELAACHVDLAKLLPSVGHGDRVADHVARAWAALRRAEYSPDWRRTCRDVFSFVAESGECSAALRILGQGLQRADRADDRPGIVWLMRNAARILKSLPEEMKMPYVDALAIAALCEFRFEETSRYVKRMLREALD